jgi:hypothetical protein
VTDKQIERAGDILRYCLVSPNEADRNLEPANAVDGLFAIARALVRLADVIEAKGATRAQETRRPASSGWHRK